MALHASCFRVPCQYTLLILAMYPALISRRSVSVCLSGEYNFNSVSLTCPTNSNTYSQVPECLFICENKGALSVIHFKQKQTSDTGSQYHCGQVGRGMQTPPVPSTNPCWLTKTDNHNWSIKNLRAFLQFDSITTDGLSLLQSCVSATKKRLRQSLDYRVTPWF